jgi:hypothetical protein
MNSNIAAVILSVLLGAALYFLVIGPAPLDPTNIAWIQGYDPPMFFLGWHSYRISPWTWPIAYNEGYGLEHASSILFSDSIPIMAMLFKLFDPLLPDVFQYFGIWFLLCFCLQAVFANLLLATWIEDWRVRLLGTAFFVLAPPMIFRTVSPEASHFTLVSQWQIIAALWLCLRPSGKGRIAGWIALCFVGIMTHPYILTMTMALWAADVFRRRLLLKQGGWKAFVGEGMTVGVFAAVVVFATGIFEPPRIQSMSGIVGFMDTGGLGSWPANLLTAFDSRGWSYLLPQIPTWKYAYEGFAFPGLGGLLLAAIAMVLLPGFLRTHRPSWTWWPIAGTLVALCVFAIGITVTLGPWELFTYRWPQPFWTLGYVFRATGRYVWPMFYFVLAMAVVIVAVRLPARRAMAVLAVLLVVQVADTHAGWGELRKTYDRAGSTWDTRMDSPFWDEAAERYTKVRSTPVGRQPYRYGAKAYFAIMNGLGTDAVHIARRSNAAAEHISALLESAIETGEWPADTLWFLDVDTVRRALPTLDRSRDALVEVDGYIVLAPGWATCDTCTRPPDYPKP